MYGGSRGYRCGCTDRAAGSGSGGSRPKLTFIGVRRSTLVSRRYARSAPDIVSTGGGSGLGAGRVDSHTELPVIEEALMHYAGKAVVNSVNLEDGEERFEQIVPIAKRYGASLVVGCIDDDPRQGIVHVVGPEQGATLPGMTVVCGDSHTSTHGALGSLAFGIGTSEVEHVLATQCLIQKKAKRMRVLVDGRPCEFRVHPGVGREEAHKLAVTGNDPAVPGYEERVDLRKLGVHL